MIGWHCGERLVLVSDNKVYFRRKCLKCGVVFKQRKRQPKKEVK
jgi:hypothetical protein